MKKTIVTKEGLEKLQQELNELKTVTRVKVGNDLKKARAFGDLSENSEYDEAKNEQAKIEARIVELEAMLKNVEIISGNESSDTVQLGTKVRVLDIEFEDECEYQLVGSPEADVRRGLISDESPVGRALIGHKAGDEVVAETPSGEIKFKILEIIG